MRFPFFPKPRLSDLPEESAAPAAALLPALVSARVYPHIPEEGPPGAGEPTGVYPPIAEVDYKPEPIWKRRSETDERDAR